MAGAFLFQLRRPACLPLFHHPRQAMPGRAGLTAVLFIRFTDIFFKTLTEVWEKCVRLPENSTFSKSNETIAENILPIFHVILPMMTIILTVCLSTDIS